jgi:hypothetical protein
MQENYKRVKRVDATKDARRSKMRIEIWTEEKEVADPGRSKGGRSGWDPHFT